MKNKHNELPEIITPLPEIISPRKKGKLESCVFSLNFNANESTLSFFNKGLFIRCEDNDCIGVYPNNSPQMHWHLKFFGRNVKRGYMKKNNERVILKGKKEKYYEGKIVPSKFGYYEIDPSSSYIVNTLKKRHLPEIFNFFSNEMLGNICDNFSSKKRSILRNFLSESFNKGYKW